MWFMRGCSSSDDAWTLGPLPPEPLARWRTWSSTATRVRPSRFSSSSACAASRLRTAHAVAEGSLGRAAREARL